MPSLLEQLIPTSSRVLQTTTLSTFPIWRENGSPSRPLLSKTLFRRLIRPSLSRGVISERQSLAFTPWRSSPASLRACSLPLQVTSQLTILTGRYHYWADVPTKKHDHIYALPKTTSHGEPSVRYRGLFINDEAPALNGWWGKFNGTSYRKLDSEFYEHVFDLLLRLKANMLWPAMWASFTPRPGNIFFTDDPKNQQLANDYGIMVSTSHHEPMQRASNEWNTTETGPWSWKENSENITKFMEEGVVRAGTNESYFTLGMRGLSDKALDGTDEAIEILTEVFEAQRNAIENVHGSASAVPRTFLSHHLALAIY